MMSGISAKRLTFAVFVFILLDLSILGINYWITYQMSEDAVVINLSGRQRMLSQRITKVLLQITPDNSSEQRQALEKELKLSFKLFFTTLDGFAKGGSVTGGDGKPVNINRLNNANAQALIQQTQLILGELLTQWHKYANTDTPITDAPIERFRQQATAQNLAVLDLMNRLTTELEHDSQRRANLLRLIQTIIFFVALLNFTVIVRGMYQQTRQALVMSEHFNSLAMHDALTGLSNRRDFSAQLSHQLNNHTLTMPNHHFALIMLDLDGFKPVNDTFGHEAGDEVLQTISQRLKGQTRADDTVARLGGDEFALIYAGIESEENVQKLATRLLHTINKPIVLANQKTVHVSASIGVALYPKAKIKKIDELIELADAAMYQAKREGKGRVVFAD